VFQRAKATIAAEVTSWPADMVEAMHTFLGKVSILGWLVRNQIIDDAPADQVPRHLDPLMRHGSLSVELLRSLGFGGWAPTFLLDIEKIPALTAWRDCLDRLQVDADTPLPT
jgi:hypothetical protein